jgi:two-component system, OmpR family, phosphate regulon sensor histidine kinase PhoR
VTFAKRLVGGTVLIVILAVGVLFGSAERAVRHALEADVANALEREARLIREGLPPDSSRWDAAIHRFARQVTHRITVIDRAGRVRADSDFPPGPLPPIENHANRPEVRAALTGTRGVASRHSATVGHALMYVAVPGGPGVVRVAASLQQVDAVVRRGQAGMAGAALLAVLIGALLAFIAGHSVSRPLADLAGTARAIAAGAPPRFPRSGVPEIDALVQALRQMHRELGERFEELRRERAESAALVESMTEGVVAADGRGHVVTANLAARRLLGYSEYDTLPDLPELFRVKAARAVVDAVLTGEPVRNREIDLDGRTLLVNARSLPASGAVLVLHDLTELRRLETVRRDFVANVSHELKTPLTSITGYTETLLSDTLDADTTRRFLDVVLANARRMHRLVDDLLDLSRIEAGRWHPEPMWTDVAAVAREVYTSLAASAAARGVELRIEPGSGGTVYADPEALRQIVTNLVDNSLRYTPCSGSIICTSAAENGGETLTVHDTGSGIAQEHLPRIFERFYRADPSRSRDEGGTGLGLAIVKHLVEAHGGRVSVESSLGDGTIIRCWFPQPPPEMTSR